MSPPSRGGYVTPPNNASRTSRIFAMRQSSPARSLEQCRRGERRRYLGEFESITVGVSNNSSPESIMVVSESAAGAEGGGFSLMSSLTGGGGMSVHSDENDSTASRLREGLTINSNKSFGSSTAESPRKVTNVSNSPQSSARSSHHLGSPPIAPTSTHQLTQAIPIEKARSFTSSSGNQPHTTISTSRRSANYRTPKPGTSKLVISPKKGSGLLGATSPSYRSPSFPGVSLSNSMDSGDVSRKSGGNVGNKSHHVRTSSVGSSTNNPAGYRDAFALLDDGKSDTGSDNKQQRECIAVPSSPSPRKGFLRSFRAPSPKRSGSGFLAIGDYSPPSQGGDSRVSAGIGESMLTVVTSHHEIPQFSIIESSSIGESPVSIATTSPGKTVRTASPLRHPSPSRLKQSIANTWSKAKGVRSRSPAPSKNLSVIGGTILRGRSPNPSQLVSQTLMEDETTIDGRPPVSGGEGSTSERNAELRRFEEALYSTLAAGNSTRNRSPSPIRNIVGEDGASGSNQIGLAKWRIPSSPGRVRRKLKQVLALPKSSSFRGAQLPQQSQQQQEQILPPQSPQELLRGWAVATDSFDVDVNVDAESPAGKISSGTKELSISESEGQEGDYFINKSSFNVFESNEFLKAMGGSVSQASVATNYIRTGDSFFDGELASDLDRAIHVYYAGLGAILTRIKEWSLERDADSDDECDDLRKLSEHDILQAVHNPETNILLLAISSILLRGGNAHFRLEQYEDACRVYTSAQSVRIMRSEATELIDKERIDIHIEDAKLNGRISNNMASALSKRGLYDEARSEYTKALQIKQGTLQMIHKASSSGNAKMDIDKDLIADIASTFHNIGLLRMNCGEPHKAEKAYKQSLSLRVKTFGLDDLGVSTSLCALGDLYFHKKQYDDAFRSYKESLRIYKLHFSKSDLKTADHYYNIGLVFYAKGPYLKAKSVVAECFRIRRNLLTLNDRLPVASALHLLGLIATSLGEYVEALSLLQETLTILQQLLPRSDHSNVQIAIGIVHQKSNDFESAMSCFSVALASRSHRFGKDHQSVAEVLQAIGLTYTEANEYDKALQTLDMALQIRKSSTGSSIEVAETLNAMSLVYFKSGDSASAAELSEEAIDVLKVAVRFDHCLVGKVLKNAGDYYQHCNAYNDSLEAYSESLRVLTAYYGKDHVFLSEVWNEIGVTQFKNGDFMTAKESFTEALRLMRLSQNEANKLAIFATLNHLGHALFKINELELAAETYIESFNIQVSIVTGVDNDGLKEFGQKLNIIKNRVATMEREGKDVSKLSDSLGGIASILRYLGLVIQEQGDFEAALSANKLSLSVRLCQSYKDHSAIALVAETIAMFEYKRNNLESAMDYFSQALEAKKVFQGESTIDVARTVNNLANIHFSLGNLDDAMELYQEALDIKTCCLGDDSDEVANTLNNIAHVLVSAGRDQEALEAYHKVVKIRQDRYGNSHGSVASSLASMGDIYIKLGQLDVAMTYFEQCVRIQKMNQEQCDERVLQNLGSIYGKLGEWQKAESTFNQIVEIKRAAHGNDCLDVARTLDLLAVSYIEQDQYLESVEHLKEALRIRKVCLDDSDDEILASLNKLAFVYESLEMTEQMLATRAEFDAMQTKRCSG